MDALLLPRTPGMRSPSVDSASVGFTDIAPDQIISRAVIQAKGAAAFDQGLPHDGHNMNPGSAAIEDWQLGWRQRRDEVEKARYDRLTRRQAAVVVAGAEP